MKVESKHASIDRNIVTKRDPGNLGSKRVRLRLMMLIKKTLIIKGLKPLMAIKIKLPAAKKPISR
ncbi:hypothetical protein KIMC2_05500 [Xylocopilactobacillus apis]|uniref:Uncharacterized protein n=1 Tax=Xylocopilactobacillus apis TaxID=2932183 RepID=A0AAU9DM93_9LACO|nr:hypothetical protein KIMC2_05500 [Xylocopilactobacillus apis]